MNIKLLCSCGTKFAFDIEPVEGRMPFTLNCPNCGLDATDYANQYIAQMLAPAPQEAAPPPPPPAAEAPAHKAIRLNVTAPSAPAPAPANSALGPTLAGVAPVSGEGLKLGLKKKAAAPEPASKIGRAHV